MRDMSEGSAHGHIWRYALPLLMGNWLQLAYNAIDSIIAGRFIGRNALAAEGIAGPIMNLVILAVTGLCIGAGILMSEYYGAKKYEQLRKALATTILAGCVGSILMAVLGILITPLLLRILSVPMEIYAITVVYLRITFIGVPFTFFYNALASGLKSVGDSKTPLKFLAFSSILNAVLDLIFLGIFHFGIVCSALTTVFAEMVSAIMALLYMYRNVKDLCPLKTEWKMDSELLQRIWKYGAPTALQQAVQPIGKLLIQGQVNALGVNVIAAFNAVTRVDDFACIPEQGIASSVSTFIAQNRGAEKYERIKPGFLAGIRLELCYWLIIGVIVWLFRVSIVSLFVEGEGTSEVIYLGSQYLKYMSLFYLWPALTNVFQGFCRGMGKMHITIINTTLQISIRTLCTYVLAPKIGLVGIAFASVIGWTIMLVVVVPYYIVQSRKINKEIIV